MENYDVFGDDLGSGMLDGLVGLGSADSFGAGSQQQQPPRPSAADTMMQGFGNQASQYAPMGQGMTPGASKLTPGYPDFTSQYGAYNPSTVQQQQPQALGAYGAAPGTPSRPMAGYPPYHQTAAAPSLHYQDYGVQSQAAMLRPTPPTQPHPPATRMVSPAAPPTPQQQQQQQQQQYGAYRTPSQDAMYVQLQRWNEQQPYTSSLPHHYPANAAAAYRPPHAYPSNLPRPPQPQLSQQNSLPQQQPQSAPTASAVPSAVNSQQPPQHNIPYMTRPQTPVLNQQQQQQQSQYTQNMYPNASSQYPDYHHSSASALNRMGSGPSGGVVPPSNVYPSASHHTQQPYSMPTAPPPQPHQPYGNQYGQYYPTGSSQVAGSQGNSMTYSAAYGSPTPSVNSAVPNGNASYRPGYAQLPQLSPRQPTPSPRQPTPSPRPPAATTPTIPVSNSSQPLPPQQANSLSQQQQQQQQQAPPPQLPPQVVPPQQNQQPSSLQQLEQMVMPHVSKSSPSPKPQMSNMGGGVMSPLGGPKTPMSPSVSGPKTPMSPTQWQTPPQPRQNQQQTSVPKSPYPPTPQASSGMSGSPGGYSISSGVMSPMQNSSIDNTISSIVRGTPDPADLDLANLNSSMDTSSECSLPGSMVSRDDTKSSSQVPGGLQPLSATSDLVSLPMTDDASSGATSEMSASESMGQTQSNSVQSNDTGFSLPGSSLHDSAIDSDGTSGLPSLGSSMDDSQTSQPQVPISSSMESSVPSSISNALNSMSPSSSVAQQQSQMSSTFTSPTSLGSPHMAMSNAGGLPPSSQSSQMGLPPSSSQSSMQVSNMISSYAPPGPQQHVQTSQGYVNSAGGMSVVPPSSSMGGGGGGMMPPPGPHQYSQRFPGQDVSGAPPQPYMGGYHNAPGYPQYGQAGVHQGQMRPPGPSPYPVGMGPMGSQGMPNQGPASAPGTDRYYEIHQLQQQLQHLYSLPPNPQTQMQINELQERLRILQQQQQQVDGMGGAGSYSMQSMQPPMGGMPNQAQMYGPGPPMQMQQGIPDMPKTDLDEPPSKQKKKKERKPRESKAGGKGKKSKDKDLANFDQGQASADMTNQMSHEVYEFQDLPPELPEKKPKKPRKPREAKPPKEKKPKEPKPPKVKTPKSTKSRKKKGQNDSSASDLNSSSTQGEGTNDLDSLAPKTDEFPEPDQKNGIGAAGITAAEGGGPSVPTSGGDGDTSTQDGTGVTDETTDAEAAPAAIEAAKTPAKPKKPKKPKLKSNSSSKKKPSKTMISLAKLKKRRRRSDSEGSDLDATPPPSPPPEDDNSNKRRSARNTGRKKYVDDIDLALSDDDLLMPSKAALKTLEAVISESAAEAASAAVTTDIPPPEVAPVVDEPKPPPPPTTTPKKSSKKATSQETPPPDLLNLNKPNFVFVNPADEDTMIVQHILSMRMGKREIIHDSSSEDEDEDAPKNTEAKKEDETAEPENSTKPEPAESSAEGAVIKQEQEDTPEDSTKKSDDATADSESNNTTTTTEENTINVEDKPDQSKGTTSEEDATTALKEPEIDNSEKPLDSEKSKAEFPDESQNQSEPEKPVTDESKMDICEDEKPVEAKSVVEADIPDSLQDDGAGKTAAEQESNADNKSDDDAVVNDQIKTESDGTASEQVKQEPTEAGDKPEADPGSTDVKPKKEKKPREPEVVEVEEFYVKYKSFSYLHCEWKTEEELLKGDKRVSGKVKRFKQKLNQNSNIFEFLEEEPFNPDFIEVDRILDVSEVTDPVTNKTTTNYLVKWKSLPYEEATWELEDDIDTQKVAHYYKFNKPPSKDQWKVKKRPKPHEWVKLDKSLVYNNNNTLREYQLEGLNWLSFSWFNGRNCILADEMGLGKTIQSLTFVESAYRYGIRGPFLILAPLSTVPNWQREFETWTDLNVIVYHGSVASRNMIQEYEMYYRHPDNPKMNIKDVYKFNVLITTFEIVLTDVMELKDLPWRLCIIDEAHRLKNKNCKLLEGLRMLNLEHRVLLSGTPLQNNVNELFSLLNFLEPTQFSSDENFSKEFGELKTESQVQKLQALLKPMMLRRLKEDVEKSIAPKQETIVEVELTNMQKKYYRAILEKNFSFLSKGTNSANIPNLMNTMMELRKCCIHPYLLNGAEEQIQLDYRIVNDVPDCDSDPDLYYKALVSSAGKMVLIDKLLPKLKANGHRVLIFSQMVRCLDILEDYLIYRKYPYERLDGRIRGPVRQAAIDRFSKPDSDRFVFLLCTKAGGLGINLTAADTVIIYDSDWNPQNDLQAQARCHRIGQAKRVKIYRLVCRNTYEREMFDRASLKLGLDKAVLQSMNTNQGGKSMESSNKQLSKKEVEDLLKRGAYGALMDDDNAGDTFCEEDIDCILERRTQVITLEQGEKGSTFSKASFQSSGSRDDINLDDPDFWKKWARKAEIDVDELGEKNELVMNEPRRRTQIKRYGHDDGLMDISDLESSTDSDEEGNIGDRTRGGRRTRSGKAGKRGRRSNVDEDFQCDDGVVEYGKWSRSECYKIEKGLLTFGWSRWSEILAQGQFRKGWQEAHVEECARVILLHCVNNFRGDEKVKSFVSDLINPRVNESSLSRKHSGLASPVSRGGRKSKKKERAAKENEVPENEDWMKEEKFDAELHLDGNYKKHLTKHSNKVLLRIRMLYYIKSEIIGPYANSIMEGAPASECSICPPSLVIDNGPFDWWDREADTSLLIGTFKHGYERYNMMRMDPCLFFLGKCGPPDGSAVLAEISSEVNEEELEKAVGGDEEFEENSNLEAAANQKVGKKERRGRKRGRAAKNKTAAAAQNVVKIDESSNSNSTEKPLEEKKDDESTISEAVNGDNDTAVSTDQDKKENEEMDVDGGDIVKSSSEDSQKGDENSSTSPDKQSLSDSKGVEAMEVDPDKNADEGGEPTKVDSEFSKEDKAVTEEKSSDEKSAETIKADNEEAVDKEKEAEFKATASASTPTKEIEGSDSCEPKPTVGETEITEPLPPAEGKVIAEKPEDGDGESTVKIDEGSKVDEVGDAAKPEGAHSSELLVPNQAENVTIATTENSESSQPQINLENMDPSQIKENSEPQPTNGKLDFPTVSDLNNRLRKLITSFQRNFKKEEIKNAQKAKRLERKEKIEQIVREREMQKLELLQRRWSKKEEIDFCKTISTFGVQKIEGGKYDWTKFRAISRLDKKFDDTLTEYFRAFYAMCKRVCGKKLSEEEEFDLIQVPVDPIPDERARRTLERIDLLTKIREEILHNEKLDERLRLCQASLDMPEWWIPGKHDKDLLYGAARHGLGRTDLFYLNDPELSFREILRRHIAGEPLVDPAEKLAYKQQETKPKVDLEPPAKRLKPDMVDIEIQDIKREREEAKKLKEAEEKEKDESVVEKEENLVADKMKPDTPTKESPVEDKEVPQDSDGTNTSKTNSTEELPDESAKKENNKEPERMEEDTATSEVKIKQEPMEVDEENNKDNTEVLNLTESENGKKLEKENEVSIKEEAVEPLSLEKSGEKEESEKQSEKQCAPEISTNEDKKEPSAKQQPEPTAPLPPGSPEKGRAKEEPEMNEVQVEIKDELKITIKLPAEKMNRVEVQVKGQQKFTMPEPFPPPPPPPPPASTGPPPIPPLIPVNSEDFMSTLKAKSMYSDSPMGTDSSNIEALGSLLNQMNPIRWPRDRAIQIRIEHIVHAVEKNEWPVSKFFSSAGVTDIFDFNQSTDAPTPPVRETQTPISECSDLAAPEDLIMSLPTPANSAPPPPVNLPPPPPVVNVPPPPPPVSTGRRGRRRRIAIDVETERAKLQALLNNNVHGSKVMPQVPPPPPIIPAPGTRGSALSNALRKERMNTSSLSHALAGLHNELDLSSESDKRPKASMSSKFASQQQKFQPPPPAHQHLPPPPSLLRASHSSRRSNSPAHRGSPNFPPQSQSSSLDLSVKSTSSVAAAAMSALSSLSSVTVTPVTLTSPALNNVTVTPVALSSASPDHVNKRGSSSSSQLSISSAPMDLSGPSRSKDAHLRAHIEKHSSPDREFDLSFGSKKQSKLENMLDKLRKRKLGEPEPPEPSQPLALGKGQKRRKLDEIVLGLSAAKGQNVMSPPMPAPKEQHHMPPNLRHHVQPSSRDRRERDNHSGLNLNLASRAFPSPSQSSQKRASNSAANAALASLFATPTSMASSSHSSSKDPHHSITQNLLNNPLLSATLSLFKSAGTDLKELTRLAAASANLAANSAGGGNPSAKKDSGQRTSAGGHQFPGSSHLPEMPKCDLSKLAEIAVPKFDLFSQDAKVNKWLAEHANLTPERPPSPDFMDGRRRRRPRVDPLLLDWNKLNGDENVPVIHRVTQKKITGPKAPQLKLLGQWLLENPMYDVDPRWADLVKEKGNLPTDLQRRLSGEKKKGPGRPPLLTSPPVTPASSSGNTVPTSSASAFSNLGAFSNLPGLSSLNPNLLANLPLGSLDPKNPLFMPFGGLGSLGNLGNLGNLGSLGNLSSLGLANPLFGFGLPGLGGLGSDLPGMPGSNSEKGGSGNTSGSTKKDTSHHQQTSHSSSSASSSVKKQQQQQQQQQDEKNKKSAAAAAAAAAASQNMLSNALPFLFPNPGLMYNPLGLGTLPFGNPMGNSAFGNLGQGSLVNGLSGSSKKGSQQKSGSSQSSSSANLSNLPGLNIPSLSKKDFAESLGSTQRTKVPPPQAQTPPSLLGLPLSAQFGQQEDSDDESLKSLMGNHADDLPEDDSPGENAERVVLKESSELEKEMAQQKMETRREKRERMRERDMMGGDSHKGLTAAERQLLMVKKKERLAKEEPMTPLRESGRTTRSSARSSRLEEAVSKMKERDFDDLK